MAVAPFPGRMDNSGRMRGRRCPVVRWVPFLAVPLAWIATPLPAQACFFYEEPEDHTVVDTTALQVVLKRTLRTTDEGATVYTTNMIVGTRAEGYVPDLGWIVAVPRHPVTNVADASTFVSLDYATAPIFRTSSGYGTASAASESSAGCGGADRAGSDLGFPEDYPDVTVWDSTEVGPYAVEVITAANVDAVRGWVEGNGLPWRPDTEPDFQHYIDLGYFFVGAKVRPSSEGAALVPLQLTYESDDPELVLPLLLDRREAISDMGLVVWIIADRPAVPRGWAQVVVPEAQIVVDADGDELSNYGSLVADAVDSVADGQGAFVTDYVQPAAVTFADLLDEPTAELVGTEGFVTRFYSRVDPEDITADPQFELDASVAPIAQLHDLTQVENGPYWGAAFRPASGFAPFALVLLGRLLVRPGARRRSSGSPRSGRRGPSR